MKKDRNNKSITDVMGTILLLSIAVVLFSFLYYYVFSIEYTDNTPSVSIIGTVDENNIFLEHHGGESLDYNTKIMLSIGGNGNEIIVGDYLEDDNNNNKWDIGEKLNYTSVSEPLNLLKVETTIVDIDSNSIIMKSVIQKGYSTTDPVISTIDASGITDESSNLNMDYNFREYSGFVRFSYKKNGDPWSYTTWEAKSGSDSYSETITGLSDTTTYYFIAQLRYDTITINGSQKSFKTLDTTVSLNTNINTISPYELDTSPYTITATGDVDLDNITLWYRWSDDNSSWAGGITDETNDNVDIDSSDIDGSSDIGIQTDFANAQDITPDSDYMNIEENFTGIVGLDEWLDCNSYDSSDIDWTELGSSPYLDSQDFSTNYIRTTGNNDMEGWFDFPSTTLTGSLDINISIYCNNDDGPGDDGADVYIDYTGSGLGTVVGRVGQHTNWEYETIDLGIHTVAELNDLRVKFKYIKSGGGDDVRIDHVRIGVSSTTSTNYELDFEYQWTGADYDQTNEEVCIYIGSHTGSENLDVNYWTGSLWSSIGTITSTGWNNFTATGLSANTYTIQLIGSTETADIEQDNWDIDVIMLHTWDSTGGPHGINWNIWSDASNPDIISPWSWDFNYPNGTGYYEFYSIGKYNDESELAPGSADARCYYNP